MTYKIIKELKNVFAKCLILYVSIETLKYFV